MRELYSYKDINLLIVGDGELKNDLVSLAKDLGVSDRVIFMDISTILISIWLEAMFLFLVLYMKGLAMLL